MTVVLIGSDTLNRPFVHYEICQSLQKNNGVIGVYIHNIKDMQTLKTSSKGIAHTVIGHYSDGRPAYFDEVCDGIYDYSAQDGYNNLGKWIEDAATKHGR